MIDFLSKNGLVKVMPSLSMVFSEEPWNDWENVENVNCLAYALNRPDLGFPFIFDIKKENISHEQQIKVLSAISTRQDIMGSCLSFNAYLVFAGLERIRAHQYDSSQRHIIAFSAYLGHFYRLDGDNSWSHKPGRYEATQVDSVGNKLWCLENARLDSLGLKTTPEKMWKDVSTKIQKQRARYKMVIDSVAKNDCRESISASRHMQRAIIENRVDISYYAIPSTGLYVSPIAPKSSSL